MPNQQNMRRQVLRNLNRGKLLAKRAEDLSDEDLYKIGRKFLFYVMTEKKSDFLVTEVAGKVLSLFHRTDRAKEMELWQSMRVTEGFLMRTFLPTLYEEFKAKGIDIDLRHFYEDSLRSDLSTTEMKKVARRAWEESGMDAVLDGRPVELKEEVQQQFRYREDLISAHLKNKKEEDLTESEVARIAKLKLLSFVLSGAIDNSSVNAAYKLVRSFQHDIRGDLERVWFEVIKPLESFYMTVLHPVIHRGFQLRGDKTPVNLVFADVLKQLVTLVENLQGEQAEPTGFDDAIVKAKRRGKWIKKTKKGDTNV
jgi:hypothetical protein